MKSAGRISVFLTAFFLMAIFMGCEKNDSDEPFGLTYIYIPQSLSSGGTNINYLVPSGLDSATHNYKIDSVSHKLNVILGVSRSGKQPFDAYTVDIAPDADTVNTAIANGTIYVSPDEDKEVVLLPATLYTLPNNISVPAGQFEGTFYLSIDINQLKTFAGKKVALAVSISNPSKYALQDGRDEVIVIINVDALNL